MLSRPAVYALIVLGLLLCISSGAALWGWSEADRYKTVASDLNKALVEAQALTGRIQAQVQAAERKAQKAQADLKEALDANPEWRDAAVPDAVADGLCKHVRCK